MFLESRTFSVPQNLFMQSVGCHGRDGSSHIFVSFLTLYSADKKRMLKISDTVRRIARDEVILERHAF